MCGRQTRAWLLPLMLLAASSPAAAQETAPDAAPALMLELNGAHTSPKGCRLTFLIANGLPTGLDRAAFEIALFDAKGVVDRLAVLDFQDLPAGKTRVTRFDLAGVDCGGISRILVNDAPQCVGAGVEPRACMRQLKPQGRTSIVFGL